MYTLEEIKTLISQNKFESKVHTNFGDSFLMSVPNFKEYEYLFGHGKTKTCYAKSPFYWRQYHRGFNNEFVFLSTSKNIDKKFSYITFCASNIETKTIKIEETDGYWRGNITGYICVHDYLHNSYPVIKFLSSCCKQCGRIIVDETPTMDINYGVINEVFENIVDLRNLEKEMQISLVKDIIKLICENIIKDI